MIHHLSFGVLNYDATLQFFKKTISYVDKRYTIKQSCYAPVVENNLVYFAGSKFFTIIMGQSACCKIGLTIIDAKYPVENQATKISEGCHLAFKAASQAQINDWYEVCLKAGAVDQGPPGPRPHYSSEYYGAFVREPSGLKIEMCLNTYDTS